jgi:opacity protein-like surface antigen
LINYERVSLDLLTGGRIWKLSNTLTLSPGALPGVELDLDESWIDPIAGARIFIDLSERLLLQARGDVGGFQVSSDFTWQALGTLGYRFSDRFTLRAGYRHLDVDFENDDGFIYDVKMSGPILGGTIAFR